MCPRCGANYVVGGEFCGRCGAAIPKKFLKDSPNPCENMGIPRKKFDILEFFSNKKAQA